MLDIEMARIRLGKISDGTTHGTTDQPKDQPNA
jgi:hypothetical protein